MSTSNKTDEKNVLPKEHTEALMKRIKTLVSMFADEEQMNGKPIFCKFITFFPFKICSFINFHFSI